MQFTSLTFEIQELRQCRSGEYLENSAGKPASWIPLLPLFVEQLNLPWADQSIKLVEIEITGGSDGRKLTSEPLLTP
jgi:hypothetical protein